MHFEACIVVEIGRTGKDLDWELDILEACLASQNIASVAAVFGGYLSSVEVRVGVDVVIVEDVMAVELRERQSLESHVEETAELVEVATSDFVARSYTDLLFDPCHLKAGSGSVIALTFDLSASRFAAYLAEETELADSVGAAVASRFGTQLDVVSPNLTTLVAEYCLR